MAQDNPARRLHSLLTNAFEIEDQFQDKQNLSSRTVWAQVFKTKDADTEVLEYLEELHFLIKHTREAIKGLPGVRHELYLKPIEFFSLRISQKGLIGDKWGNQGRHLRQQHMLDLLEATADAIDNDNYLIELTQEQLNGLLSDAKSMLEEVLNSDLDNDIKMFLVIRLEEICSAIQHYAVSGSAGLRKVVEANIGSTLLKSFGVKTEETNQLRKFVGLMVKIGSWIGILADTESFLLPKVSEIFRQLPPG